MLLCIIDMRLLVLGQLGMTTSGSFNKMELPLIQVNIGKLSLDTMMKLRMWMDQPLRLWFLGARQTESLQKQIKAMMLHMVCACQAGYLTLVSMLMTPGPVIVEQMSTVRTQFKLSLMMEPISKTQL